MNTESLKPVGPWVLIKVDPPKIQTEAGLYLPEGNLMERKGPATGTVVAAGSGKPLGYGRAEMPVKPGDKVLFRGFLQEAHRPNGVEDREHCLLHVDDVLGILEDE
jgi:co-chaperonin GroES (HSP10)